jgi:hypothetical protein
VLYRSHIALKCAGGERKNLMSKKRKFLIFWFITQCSRGAFSSQFNSFQSLFMYLRDKINRCLAENEKRFHNFSKRSLLEFF